MSDEPERKRLRDELLMATLPHVAFEGWTDRALRAGNAACGVSAAEAELAFPGGSAEMIAHWSAWSDERMLAALAAIDLAAMSGNDRLALAMRSRLETNVPYREAVRRALAYLALPMRAGLGAKLTWRTADAIVHAAGETATDFSFYTRRALVAGVYAATLLVWLDDDSEAFVETSAFLDRRIAGLSRLSHPATLLARIR